MFLLDIKEYKEIHLDKEGKGQLRNHAFNRGTMLTVGTVQEVPRMKDERVSVTDMEIERPKCKTCTVSSTHFMAQHDHKSTLTISHYCTTLGTFI